MNEETRVGGSSDRPMIEGEWECSGCGTKITALPFQPSEGRPVFCKDCYKKDSGQNRRQFKKPMVEGNWQCADCGKTIAQLPFQPKEGQSVSCRDCYIKNNPR